MENHTAYKKHMNSEASNLYCTTAGAGPSVYFKKKEEDDTECPPCIIDLFDGRLQADLQHSNTRLHKIHVVASNAAYPKYPN